MDTIKILLADNEEDNYVLLQHILSEIMYRGTRYPIKENFNLEQMESYDAALKAMERNQHDVCIVNYSFSDNGLKLLHEAIENGCKIPIILLIEERNKEVEKLAEEAGATDYLNKDEISVPLMERSIRYSIERAQMRQKLRENEERYMLVALSVNDGLWEWNLITDEFVFSSQWKSMLGYEKDEIGNSKDEWFNRIHPEDVEQVQSEISVHLEDFTPYFQNEHRMLHKDETYRWIVSRGMAARDLSGKPYRMIGSQTDITERKTSEVQLRQNAFYDALTELPNRSVFIDRLGRSIERTKRHGDYLFAVLFLDLDDFKIVNDSLGHLAGDKLLVEVARRLETCLRTSDTVARFGGDEFAILLEDIRDVSDAMRVTNRIQEELMAPVDLDEQEVFTSASIGIALSTNDYSTPDEILRDADTAMYSAKERGKARHQMFDKQMHTRALSRLQLENDLRRAIRRHEFRVYYQPIISLKTGKIVGFEALVRWQHPDRGLVSPAAFIPIAQESGLIIDIDRWVLHEACGQMHIWHAQFPSDPPLFISANLSSKQFATRDLLDHIRQVLKDTELEPQTLRPEITESEIMEDFESATRILSQLKDQNILLHMDDFGTGYSSLSYLVRFYVKTLKIDGSFVSNMDIGNENFEIVRMIVTLAHNLGMDVVAEGVETAKQQEQLKALQCEYAQGYLYSKPLDSKAVGVLLESNPHW